MELTGIDTHRQIRIVDENYDNSKMNKEDFLKVLLADIQWQNPLEVNDISSFINNSVKLREIEILNNFEDVINSLKELNSSSSLLSASNLIGKKIRYEGNRTYIENGHGVISFSLKGFAEKVTVNILDSNGNIVETKTFTSLDAGKEYPLEIDNGNLEDGYYTVSIDAINGNEKVDVNVFSEAYVEGVLKDGSEIKVLFSDKSVPISNIKQIGG